MGQVDSDYSMALSELSSTFYHMSAGIREKTVGPRECVFTLLARRTLNGFVISYTVTVVRILGSSVK